jgi:Holliday junction resolvase RusA-like endonuclease
LSITLTLPFPPSVNNLFINAGRKRVRSPKYRAWADEAGALIVVAQTIYRQAGKSIATKGPVRLLYEFQEGQDKRKRDIDNLVKPVNDLLVTHGIIQADDNTVVRAIDLRWSDKVLGVRITVEAA